MLVEIQTIEQLRKAKGISYDDLESQNLSRGTYHAIINGKRNITPKSMKKMTEIFKISENDIIPLIQKNIG